MSGTTPIPPEALDVRPADEASWDDLRAVFGTTDHPGRCQCRRYKAAERDWRAARPEERAERLREESRCGTPDAESTTGLVAYFDGEPVGWAAVEPRIAYPRLLRTRVPWTGRREDEADAVSGR